MNMNVMGGVGGPVGGQQMMNMGTPGNAPGGNGRDDTHRNKLHTYMYDYFLRNGMFDMARMLLDKVEIETADPKQSPGQRNMNGDSMEQDSKDNILGKPDDLPMPKIAPCDSSFLLDWWGQFWDCYLAQRGRGTQQTKQYLSQVQVSRGRKQRVIFKLPVAKHSHRTPRGCRTTTVTSWSTRKCR